MKNKGKQSKSKGKASKEEVEQKKEDRKKSSGKSPQTNQKGKANNQEEDKKKQEEKGKKLETFNLDFIYRREKFTVQKLAKNILISRLKLIIAKKISVEANVLVFFYKDKELKAEDDKKNVFEMIKDDPIPFIEVKKVPKENQDIISLNSKVNLVYKVTCSPVNSYSDLVDKIEQFFRDICLEKHYLCEPTDKNKYDVCFSCSDHCFQFKRYMMNLQRTDKQYEKTKFEVQKVDKTKVIEPKIEHNVNKEKNIEEDEKAKNTIKKMKVIDKKTKKEVEFEYKIMKQRENDYFQKEFVNVGPYESYEDIKKKMDKDDKTKWVSKKKFSVV
jgi:hypothetical protein